MTTPDPQLVFEERPLGRHHLDGWDDGTATISNHEHDERITLSFAEVKELHGALDEIIHAASRLRVVRVLESINEVTVTPDPATITQHFSPGGYTPKENRR